jgi:hypothetical protein
MQAKVEDQKVANKAKPTMHHFGRKFQLIQATKPKKRARKKESS